MDSPDRQPPPATQPPQPPQAAQSPQPSPLVEALTAAAPALAVGLPLIVKLLTQDRTDHDDQEMQVALERHQLEQGRLELALRERALERRAAELEREHKRLQEEAARLAPTPDGKGGLFQRRRRPPPPRIVTTYGFDERHQERLLVPEFITYAWCAAFLYQTPRTARAQVSKARRSQYARIARLPPLLGEKLDKAGVPFYALRFVAYAETFVEQEERARKVLAGERPPRRMPQPPEEPKPSKATKRPRGRPAYPRAQPRDKNKPRADEQSSPTAQPHGDEDAEQQGTQLRELMSLLTLHFASKLEGSSEPDNEGDDDLDEEAPL
ncbi:uncharacterized protein SOCE26_011310 [Sorangium cellulosum]|uniref:Uncharacterized protein n=1 Tax=Sorangium cellulosum TaxID=56 RepID=A0A2L0EKA8_SORCE|nr:hypothetical protein [Sorangium cellulosum]AUX39736.1 uncharacterized protein SOCE26_011310 [Sorangium cellulosum]